MKLILVIILMLSACYAADPVSEAALFVDGFLRGALAKDIGRVDGCLKDGDQIVADIGKLVQDVQGGFDLLPLVMDIANLLRDIPNSMTDCTDLEPTVKATFDQWGEKIKDPLTIGKIVLTALFKYRGQLTGDANGFLADFQNGNFELSGQELGDIPHILFDMCSEEEVKMTPADVGHFLDGFLTAALQREITEVESCLKDADVLIDDLTKFIEDIEGGFDLLPLIGDLGKLFTDIPHSIEDCSDFAEDVDKVLATWEEELTKPVVVAQIVYIALAQYEDRLKGDASSFVADWKSDVFEQSGSDLGDIPHVLFDLCPAGDFGMVESLIKSI